MEIFITGLDSGLSQNQLKHLLSSSLDRLQIYVYEIKKKNYKTFAHLTLADSAKAEKLLRHAEQTPGLLRSPSNRFARLSKSNRRPDHKLIRVLQKEEKDQQARKTAGRAVPLQSQPQPQSQSQSSTSNQDLRQLGLQWLECGRWETTNGSLAFVPYYFNGRGGLVTTENGAFVIKISTSPGRKHEIVIDPYSMESLSLSKIAEERTVTITLNLAPKIYEDESGSVAALADALGGLDFGSPYRRPITKYRETSLPGSNPTVMGTCLTYRLGFQRDIKNFKHSIQRITSYQIPLSITQDLPIRPLISDHTAQVTKLNADVVDKLKCSFSLRYQIQALWANALLSPEEVQKMLPAMSALRNRSGEKILVTAIQRLVAQLPVIDATTKPRDGGHLGAIASMEQQEQFLLHDFDQHRPTRDEVSVHRVTVTPTGLYLYGPEEFAANRVLRQYRAHEDCFLRVLFADEDEGKIEYDRDISNDRILQGRFLTILRNGLDVAGEHFDFLGFSNSSLKTRTCWFMRPFVHDGSLMFAGRLIIQLGDFSGIRCPAKCAARIGQAFSESTSAVSIDERIVKIFPDVTIGKYMFTDGCGTISKQAWRLLKGNSSSKDQPTSYQIRYKGAKGMLSLDSRLRGHEIRLRESMVKFKGSPSNEIEICGTNARSLSFKLNRPMIKILEDLDVPASTFETLQEQAIQKLHSSARSPESAMDFVKLHLSDSSSGLSPLLRVLQKIGIDVTEDAFLRDVLGALLQVQLREIKYRSRIPVPDATTVYGISDETGWLKEGEVFVTFTSEETKKRLHINGRVAVTRSPAMHPGDIQIVQAVVPPEDSSLWELRNCIAFSQHGDRDLPSMLGGGDLDGDLYNVIFDDDLMPQKTFPPAAYAPATAIDIGRPVTSADMAGFFVDFMQNDQLGRIAMLHLAVADDKSTNSSECLLLAELYTTAVDFPKSGVPVDIKKIPRTEPYRPDFMAPSASTKVEKGVKRPADLVDLAPPEGNQRYRYYESDKILGKLFRAIDEDLFFLNLEDDVSSIFSKEPANTVLGEILEWVHVNVDEHEYMRYWDLAKEVRNYYESTMLEWMSTYAARRKERLTEKEVFIGTILGRSGAGSQFQRERSEYMKKGFNLRLRDTKSWMEGQTEDDEQGFLHLSVACLSHAVWATSNVDQNLRSFGWFAAGLCVPKLFQGQEEMDSVWGY